MNGGGGQYGQGAVEAVNEALIMLGEDRTLETLTKTPDAESDPNASVSRKAAYVFETARRRVLNEYPWRFLAAFSKVASVPDGRNGWVCEIPCGADQIQTCYTAAGERPDYVVCGGLIHSAEPLDVVAHTRDEEAVEDFPAHVRELLVARLAADLAKPVTGRSVDVKLYEERYADALDRAKYLEARQNHPNGSVRRRNTYADAMHGEDAGGAGGGRSGAEDARKGALQW